MLECAWWTARIWSELLGDLHPHGHLGDCLLLHDPIIDTLARHTFHN